MLDWLLAGVQRCAALSCEHKCHTSPQGGVCFCPDGFIVANDSRSCAGEIIDCADSNSAAPAVGFIKLQ